MQYISEMQTGIATSFLHLTDLHLQYDASAKLNNWDTFQSFTATLDEATRRHPDVDYILITGDISQDASMKSYQIFESIIRDCNIPVYTVPGNHDDAEYLRQIIDSSPVKAPTTLPHKGHTLILLDSTVPNRHRGQLNYSQLRQLDTQLGKCDSELVLIAVHHPPVHINCKWLDRLSLLNGDHLLQIISNHDLNTLLLCGHIHQELDLNSRNMRILATPSTCYQFKPYSAEAHLENSSQPTYRYVAVNKGGSIFTQTYSLDWYNADRFTIEAINW